MIDFYNKRLEEFLIFYPNNNPKDPSPEEIRRICLEIQTTWTESTRQSRKVSKCKPATMAEAKEMEEWLENNC